MTTRWVNLRTMATRAGPQLLILACALGTVVVAPPAQAITYWVSGIYAYGGSGNCTVNGTNTGNSRCGSMSGYFNWNGSALSGGALSLGAPANEPVGGTAPFNFIAITPARDRIIFFNNNGSNSPDGLVLRFAQPLPNTPPGPFDSPGLNATVSNSFFCRDATSTGSLTNNSITWGGTCASGQTTLTDLSGTVAAPAPLPWLGLAAVLPFALLRRRYGVIRPARRRSPATRLVAVIAQPPGRCAPGRCSGADGVGSVSSTAP